MGKVVQAKCPHCQQVLRIPGDWLHQAMRCKNCQQIFQARPKSAARPPVAVAQSAVAVPAAALVPSGAPSTNGTFDFGSADASPSPFGAAAAPAPFRRRGSRRWIGVVAGMAVILVAAACLVIAGPFLMDVAKNKADRKTTPDDAQVAKANPQLDGNVPIPKSKIFTDPKEKQDTAKKGPSKKNNTAPPMTKVQDGGPKKANPPTKKGSASKTPPSNSKGPLPRRALTISVNDYLLANPLNYGKDHEQSFFPGSSTGAVLHWFANIRMKFPRSQLTELSDYSLTGDAPLKSVIENTITEFLTTSRSQDRIVLLFSGHVAELDEQAYLVPIEGDRDDARTLIPLNWVYEQLVGCPARQKIFIVDVCRYDPARGLEREGGEPMSEILEKQLKNPPAGVEVWASCSLEQQSLEFENGSLFMEALCFAMRDRQGIPMPDDPIPMDELVSRVNEYLAKRLEKTEWKQTTFVAGSMPTTGAPYNPNEPLPQTVKIQPPNLMGGAAGRAVVKGILDEINSAPPPRVNRGGSTGKLRFGALPPFPAAALEEFKDDGYLSEMDFLKKKEEFPLRHAIVQAKQVMKENANAFQMKEYFDGPINDNFKKAVFRELEKPGKCKFELEEALEELLAAEKYLKMEPSKRWQAHYHYVTARLKSRLLYVLEYQTVLAKIRTGELPELDKSATGYRLASQKRFASRETESRAWRAEVRALWNNIIDEYPDTPWALMARRERATSLGLEWRPARR